MGTTLQRLRAVCAATARLFFLLSRLHSTPYRPIWLIRKFMIDYNYSIVLIYGIVYYLV